MKYLKNVKVWKLITKKISKLGLTKQGLWIKEINLKAWNVKKAEKLYLINVMVQQGHFIYK